MVGGGVGGGEGGVGERENHNKESVSTFFLFHKYCVRFCDYPITQS